MLSEIRRILLTSLARVIVFMAVALASGWVVYTLRLSL